MAPIWQFIGKSFLTRGYICSITGLNPCENSGNTWTCLNLAAIGNSWRQSNIGACTSPLVNCTQRKFFEHLGKMMKYPQMAKEADIQGKVFVSFVVDKNGKVSKDVLRGVAGGKVLDDEAVRMVKTLPDFTPGKQRGKSVQARYSIPIKFSLK